MKKTEIIYRLNIIIIIKYKYIVYFQIPLFTAIMYIFYRAEIFYRIFEPFQYIKCLKADWVIERSLKIIGNDDTRLTNSINKFPILTVRKKIYKK